MGTVRISDVLWITLELNPLSEVPSQSGPPNLLDLCSEILISNVCLLRQKVHFLPKKIYSILFMKAVDKYRILSIVELIKHCPFEEIELLTPRFMGKLSSVFTQQFHEEEENYYNVALSILSTFLKMVKKEIATNSQLRTLNLGLLPLSKPMLKLLVEFIEESQGNISNTARETVKHLKFNPRSVKNLHDVLETCRKFFKGSSKSFDLQGKYVLKCAFLLENEDLLDVIRCYLSARAIGFKLIISGVLYHNAQCPGNLFMEVMRLINHDDFQLLAAIFSEFLPHPEHVCSEMKKFHNLQYLNLSCMRSVFLEDSSFQEFAQSLVELSSLKRLVLQSIKLTGRLLDLFCKYCKRKQDASRVTRCCVAHSGFLEYLDVSGCSLVGTDLEVLKEFSASSALKYLDISDNSLGVGSTLQTLLLLSPSLLVLNMERCFHGLVEYDSEMFPLSAFTQIRILNIKGMEINLRNSQMLHSEIEKMRFECILTDDLTYDLTV